MGGTDTTRFKLQKMWYKDFFTDIALEFWEKSHDTQMTKDEVAFLHQLFRLPKGARLLDMLCGYGRHAIAMARKGYVITGVDIAQLYISQLEEQAKRYRLPIDTLNADLSCVQLLHKYSGAYCLGNSISYFDRSGTVNLLKNVGQHLQPNSLLVLHTGMLAESILPNLVLRDWQQAGELFFLMEHEHNMELGRLDTQLTFIKDGKTEKRTIYHYIYTYAEMGNLLAQCGFKLLTAYANPDGEPFAFGDEQAYLVAQKI